MKEEEYKELYMYGSNGLKYKVMTNNRKIPIGRLGKRIATPRNTFLLTQFQYIGVKQNKNNLL